MVDLDRTKRAQHALVVAGQGGRACGDGRLDAGNPAARGRRRAGQRSMRNNGISGSHADRDQPVVHQRLPPAPARRGARAVRVLADRNGIFHELLKFGKLVVE